MNRATMVRVLRVWAEDAAALANALARQDSSWGTETFPLAGGHVVLCGAGMYVNRAIAVGLDGPLSSAEWAQFEARCDAVGVAPCLETSPATDAGVLEQLTTRGYRLDGSKSATFYELGTAKRLPDRDPTFVIEPANDALLPVWQATSAAGWGHATPTAVKVSNAFARAAAEVDDERFVVASDRATGQPVGCASLTVRDGVATLGAMSTMPAQRRRGVQSALIVHRLRTATALGCDLATSTAVPGGDSERNLLRHGFEPWFALDAHTLVDHGARESHLT